MAQPEVYDRVVGVGVDMLNDFFPPNGSLPVKEGDQVVAPFNTAARWIRNQGGVIVYVNDAHPAETNHFSDTPNFQTTWPVHCVVDTPGAEFHPDLEVELFDITMLKGTKRDEDAYSGFQAADGDGRTLRDVLQPKRRGERIAMVMGGVATDYCDRETAIHGVEFAATINPDEGRLDVYALLDAMRPVNPKTGEAALHIMKAAGVRLITSDELIAGNIIQLQR